MTICCAHSVYIYRNSCLTCSYIGSNSLKSSNSDFNEVYHRDVQYVIAMNEIKLGVHGLYIRRMWIESVQSIMMVKNCFKIDLIQNIFNHDLLIMFKHSLPCFYPLHWIMINRGATYRA